MNPLLPEPATNLGRNVSFAAKPGAKTDSEDSTRFQDTLQANTPERQKTTATKSNGSDNSSLADGGPSDNATVQTQQNQPVPESGSRPPNGNSLFELESEVDSNPLPADGQLIVLETARLSVDDSVTEGGAPVFAAVSDNADKSAASTPSLLQTGKSAEIPSRLAYENSSSMDASIQASISNPATLNSPAGDVAQAVIPDTGFASETAAQVLARAGTATGIARKANSDTATVTGKRVLNTAQVELEKPFTAFETDLNLTDSGADKKNLIGKPAGAAVNPDIPFSPRSAFIKSNLDWHFANRMPGLEADAALDIPSPSKGSSSATGTAYAAVSVVAALQINEAAADHRLQMPVNIKFGQPEWAGMVAERTAMMAAQKITFAELQLDPPELGPLQVKVTVQNEQASVTFVSASPAVRDSLEQTASRLREMLDQQGLDLVDVNVADQSDRQQQNSGDSHSNSRKALNAENEIPTEGTVNLMTVVASGIDHYV